MIRRIFSILSLLLLLLCAATVVLWVRSWRHLAMEEDRYSWLDGRGERLTVRSDAGRVTLFVPPGKADAVAATPLTTFPSPLGTGPSTRESVQQSIRSIRSASGTPLTARQIATLLRNDQVAWFIDGPISANDSTKYVYLAYACESPPFLLGDRAAISWWRPDGTVIPPLVKFTDADAMAALLLAMEDPDRFAIAHFLLISWFRHVSTMGSYDPIDGNRIQCKRDGLRFVLTLKIEPLSSWDPTAAYDLTQMPNLRDQWHRRLDVARASTPWWSLTAGTAVLPVLWLIHLSRRRLIRRSRRRSGRCIACGYDLRASPAICPECGTKP